MSEFEKLIFGEDTGGRDPYTMKHLDAWLLHEIHGDTARDEIRARMLSLYDDDPEYWGSQSWWNLYDRSERKK